MAGTFRVESIQLFIVFVAIFTLPQPFTQQQKCRMFLFLLLILGQSLLSFQYNITVAYLFLFAYTLLEKDRGFLAVLLIMISGCTKVYGIFELALLLCYPHVWRNFGYAVAMGIVLLALPLIKIAPADLLPIMKNGAIVLLFINPPELMIHFSMPAPLQHGHCHTSVHFR